QSCGPAHELPYRCLPVEPHQKGLGAGLSCERFDGKPGLPRHNRKGNPFRGRSEHDSQAVCRLKLSFVVRPDRFRVVRILNLGLRWHLSPHLASRPTRRSEPCPETLAIAWPTGITTPPARPRTGAPAPIRRRGGATALSRDAEERCLRPRRGYRRGRSPARAVHSAPEAAASTG